MAQERRIAPKYTVEKDGKKVWINGMYNCLGRFHENGYEIYRAMSEKTDVIGTTATLEVRVRPTTAVDWPNFVLQIKEHHGIDISDMEYS